MKVERTWVYGGLPNLHYYTDHTGRIVGETSIVGTGNTNKFSTAVYPDVNSVHNLGMYITSDYAQKAIESFWRTSDKVYDTPNTILELYWKINENSVYPPEKIFRKQEL